MADSLKERLIARFRSGQARIAVIGLGYVGLPLAVVFAEAGYRVVGIDVDPQKVEAVNRGESYIADVSRERLARLVDAPCPVADSSGCPSLPAPSRPGLSATTDFAVLADCDAVSICVPTPLSKTGDPDISYIVEASTAIGRYLHPGMVIVLESTTYPGTTREVVLPILQGRGGGKSLGREERAAPGGSGLARPGASEPSSMVPGRDFFLAYSPERVDPGRRDWTIRNTPKVIGGMTPACLEVAMAFYGRAMETLVPVSSPDAAEMAKLFENTFRMVNIGLANELLMMCDKLGLDAWEVLDAADTKPFGFMKFTPGPGLGGHCIPVDPHYLSWKMRSLQYTARFIELASEINTQMPHYWVQRVQDALNEQGKPLKGSRILVLGVAYKRDVGDLRESPALDIIHLLQAKGASVAYHDPHVPTFCHDGLAMAAVADLPGALSHADCVVIATDHSGYDWGQIRRLARCIVDTRHVLAALDDMAFDPGEPAR